MKSTIQRKNFRIIFKSVYLGSGAYGVAAASLEYFDKSIKELTYDEAALLAALPKAPSKYNPYRDIKLANLEGLSFKKFT